MSSITRTFVVDGPVTASVIAHVTDVEVRTTSGHDISVVLTCGDDSVALEPATIECRGDRLTIEVPPLTSEKGGAGFTFAWGKHSFNIGSAPASTTLEIELPEGSSLQCHTSSGDVRADGRLGEVNVETQSGDVHLDEADRVLVSTGSGDVRLERAEQANVRCGSGDVEIEQVGELMVKTGSGDIRVENATTLSAKAGSGDIEVSAVTGAAQLASGSGEIRLDAAGTSTRAHSSSGEIAIGGIGAGSVVAQTASGEIQAEVVRGIPVWTEVTSVSGDIESQLSSRGEPVEGQPYVELTLNTVSGDITLSDC